MVTGYDGAALDVGSRVGLHPATDLWMQGARYGEIMSIRDVAPVASGQTVILRLDRFAPERRFSVAPNLIRGV